MINVEHLRSRLVNSSYCLVGLQTCKGNPYLCTMCVIREASKMKLKQTGCLDLWFWTDVVVSLACWVRYVGFNKPLANVKVYYIRQA